MHLPQLNCCLDEEETAGSGIGGDETVSSSVGLICNLSDFLFKFGLELTGGSGGGGGGGIEECQDCLHTGQQ